MTLPNFVIAGAMKAGTTSLLEYLGQHPQVYKSPIKETRFFTFDPDDPEHVSKSYRNFPVRTMDAYLEQFADVRDEIAIGEATPNYLISPHAPLRMKEIIPDVRLVFSLRHPVNRLYSIYLMGVTRGAVTGNIYEDLNPNGSLAKFHRYSPYFRLWRSCFDLSQMKIILFEDFKSNPVAVIQSLYRYLAVDDQFAPDTTRRYNVGGVPKNRFAAGLVRGLKRVRNLQYFRMVKPYLPDAVRSWNSKLRGATLRNPDPLPEDLARALTAYYRDDVLELQDLLEVDLSAWNVV
jgi:hypothetical protein